MVYKEVKDYFIQVLNGYSIKMSELCPFKQLDIIAEMYRLDKYAGRR